MGEPDAPWHPWTAQHGGEWRRADDQAVQGAAPRGSPGVTLLSAGKEQEEAAMTGAPDQYRDEAKLHAADLQRAMQRDQVAKTKMLTRLRLIVRRVLGRQNPPASP